MELAEVDERYRITIPKSVTAALRIVKGQRFYLVPHGNVILMKPVPTDPSEKLEDAMGDFRFDGTARRRGEGWLLNRQGRSEK